MMPTNPAPDIPSLTSERLTAMQHHLRGEISATERAGSRPLWMMASAAVVLIVVVTTLAGLRLAPGTHSTGGAQRDLYPERISAGERVRIEQQCRNDPFWHQPLNAIDNRGLLRRAELVALDRQGDYYSVVLAADGKVATCVFQDQSGHPSGGRGFDGPRELPITQPSGTGLAYVTSNDFTSTVGASTHTNAAFLIGRAGPKVTDVALRLTDGTRVHATLSNGWWQAQYPDLNPTADHPLTVTAYVTDVTGHTRTTRFQY